MLPLAGRFKSLATERFPARDTFLRQTTTKLEKNHNCWCWCTFDSTKRVNYLTGILFYFFEFLFFLFGKLIWLNDILLLCNFFNSCPGTWDFLPDHIFNFFFLFFYICKFKCKIYTKNWELCFQARVIFFQIFLTNSVNNS